MNALARLMIVAAAGFISFTVTLSALPAWLARAGYSVTAAGAATTVMLAATVASQVFVPALLRRVSTLVVLGIGLVLLTLPTALLLVSTAPLPLYGTAVVRGIGFGLFTVAASMRTVEVAGTGGHGRVTGLFGLAAGIPSLVFVPLGVVLLRWGLWPVIAIAVATALPALLTNDDDRSPVRAAARGRLLPALRAAGPPSLLLAAMTMTTGVTMTILPIERPHGWVAGIGLTVLGLAQTAVRWLSGTLVDRVGTVVPSLVTGLCGVAGLALLGFGLGGAGLGGAGTSGVGLSGAGTSIVLLACALVGVGYGGSQTVTMVAAFARAEQAEKPVASAVWNAAFDTGTALGAALIGLALAALGTPGAYLALAVLALLTVPAGLARATPRPRAS